MNKIEEKISLIIDTDMAYGSKDADVDDCLALLMALNNPNFDIKAITAVGGNVPPQMASYNIDSLLKELKIDIPHSYSCANPLDRNMWINCRWLKRKNELPKKQLSLPSSVALLEKTLIESQEKITIVAIGPLTNLAILLTEKPFLVKKINKVCIMGGTQNEIGVDDLPIEFNFRGDPEAANLVLGVEGLNVEIFPLEITKKQAMKPQDIEKWSERGFINRIKISLRAYMDYRSKKFGFNEPFSYFHDVLPIVSLLDKKLFQMEDCYCTVDSQGKYTKGSLILDRKIVKGKESRHKIVVDGNCKEVLKKILKEIPSKWEEIK